MRVLKAPNKKPSKSARSKKNYRPI